MSINKLVLKETKSGRKIRGRIDHSEYGLFGTCYSQPKELVENLCEQTSTKIYNTKTRSHELGQWTVDIVLSALNALPNVKAWQTPPNSTADVHWKWDVIIDHEDYFYPVQVKSGLDAIEQSQTYLSETLEKKLNKLDINIQKIEKEYENRIEGCMRKYGLTSRKNATLVAIIKEKEQKITPLRRKYENYSKSQPLYIWASRDEDSIKALTRIFAEVFNLQDISKGLEDKALRIYSEKQKNYQESLIEEETQKIEYISETINVLKNYLTVKEKFLLQQRQMCKKADEVVLLEDIISPKIAENTLILAEKILKKSGLILNQLINNIYSHSTQSESNPKYILSNINIGIGNTANYYANRYTHQYDLMAKDKEIIELYLKIKKLIHFSINTNSSILAELNNLINKIQTFAEKYNISIMTTDKHPKKITSKQNILIIQEDKQHDDISLNSIYDAYAIDEYGI